MLSLTTTDTRSEDMAAIVATAGRPGLKARVAGYRAQVLSAKATQKASS